MISIINTPTKMKRKTKKEPVFPSRILLRGQTDEARGSMLASSMSGSTGRSGCGGKTTAPIPCGAPKAAMIYRTTGNLRAGAKILLGHSKIENTVRYLGVDVEDALVLAERIEI